MERRLETKNVGLKLLLLFFHQKECPLLLKDHMLGGNQEKSGQKREGEKLDLLASLESIAPGLLK
jgi:hypothetical protein